MFKKALLALGLIIWAAYGLAPVVVQAQNTTCSDRPDNDESNACANTRFVMQNAGGSSGSNPEFWANCLFFTATTNGCVPASGGGTLNYLRADGTWAQPPGTIPVGGVIPWAGATVPPGYFLTFGQAVARATFTQLLTAITFTESVICTLGSPSVLVLIGTIDRVPIGTPVEGACFTAGTTVAGKSGGFLVMSTNAVASTTAPLQMFPWGNGDGSTTFNVPNLQGRTVVGRDNMSGSAAGVLTSTYYGAVPDAVNVPGGAQSITLVTANFPAYTPSGAMSGSVSATVNDPGHTHSISNLTTFILPIPYPGVTSGGVAASLSFTGTGTANSNTTGITVTNSTSGMTFTGNAQGGSSTPFSTVQPSITMDYIIKAFDIDTSTITELTVGVTVITGGSNNTILYDNAGVLGELAFATYPDMYAGTPLKVVSPATIWPPEVVITYGTTTTLDMSTFRDAVITLTGNITTMTLSNVTVGKSGSITFIQDGTGSRTTVWDSKFKFAGGTAPVLTTAASAVDILSYQCRTSTFCFAAMMNDVK